MAVYEYVAKTKEGKILKGKTEDSTKERIIDILHDQGMVIISLKEVKKSLFTIRVPKKISSSEVVIFTRQLTTLIESGVSLVQALEILSDQVTNIEFKRVIGTVLTDVREGKAFNAALVRFSKVFSSFYVSMVKAGEVSGNLSGILSRISGYLEKTIALQRKVKSSLTYPVVVICMAILITMFLIVKVIPTFKEIFISLNAELPIPTMILLGLSDFLRANLIWIIFGLVGISFVIKNAISTPKGRRVYDKFILEMPIFGPILRKVAIAQFCRTFSTLVKSGVPILNALDIVGATSGNVIIEEAVSSSKKSVQEGEPLSEPLMRSTVFPPMVTRMIAIGEKTGKLEEMLTKISQFYEEEVEAAVEGLTSLIEPLIIGFLGIVIGGIVVALFLPILKITQFIGG